MEVCIYCDRNTANHARGCPYADHSKMIAGRSLADWKVFARRDDCLDQMVPSDLRQILEEIPY